MNPIDTDLVIYQKLLGTNVTVGGSYKSPLSNWKRECFGLFERNGRILWKDFYLNEIGTSEDLFEKLTGIPYFIANSLDVNSSVVSSSIKKKKVELDLRPKKSFSEKGLKFWEQFNINKDILKKYKTKEIEAAYLNGRYVSCFSLSFGYFIGRKAQLYRPEAKPKFLSGFSDREVFGYNQLPDTGNILIIDKSMKDVMFNHSIGLPAIASVGESNLIPDAVMKEVKDRFKRVILMLDNDRPGKKAAAKYLARFSWLEEKYLVTCKDKTDMCYLFGVEETVKELASILKL